MAAIGRRGCTGSGLLPSFLVLTLFLVFTITVRNVESAETPFDWFFQRTIKTAAAARSNGSQVDGGVFNNAAPRLRPNSQILDEDARRIQTIYQLLEHRPDIQTCYAERPDRRTFRFFCPTPPLDSDGVYDETGWKCITLDDLCNNIPDCPNAEDEDFTHCMFYSAIQHQTQTIRQVIVRHFEQAHAVPNTVRN